MTEERERVGIGKIKDILPILWSSYEHIYEVRETGTTSGINFLMIIATFLPIFCLTSYSAFKSPLFLFPILFQVAALLILLKRYFIKGQIPWLKLKETLLQLDDNSFAVELFAALKACENGTYMRLRALNTVIKMALALLVFSIFLTALASLFMLLKGSVLLYVATALLVIVFLLLCFFYKQVPRFDFANEEKNVKNDIEKWLKEHGTEKGDGSGPDSQSASPNK
ncbi:MAG: hypothetical protein V1685_01550 [Parcubacteria group bacterium]